MAPYQDTLRSLALNDEQFVAQVLGMSQDTVEASHLEPKTHALLRLGAALAVDAAPSSYQSIVGMALAAGASFDEIVGCLVAVAPTIGLVRVVSAAPDLALALGYDVDAALEAREPGLERPRTSAPPPARMGHSSDRDDAPAPATAEHGEVN